MDQAPTPHQTTLLLIQTDHCATGSLRVDLYVLARLLRHPRQREALLRVAQEPTLGRCLLEKLCASQAGTCRPLPPSVPISSRAEQRR